MQMGVIGTVENYEGAITSDYKCKINSTYSNSVPRPCLNRNSIMPEKLDLKEPVSVSFSTSVELCSVRATIFHSSSQAC